MSGLLELARVALLPGAGALFAASGAITAAYYKWRASRKASAAALLKLQTEGVRRAAENHQEASEASLDNRALFHLLLEAPDLLLLQQTKQGVALDLAQMCSVTRLPPSRVRESITRLLELGLLQSESETTDRTVIRYRKQVADEVIGGGE